MKLQCGGALWLFILALLDLAKTTRILWLCRAYPLGITICLHRERLHHDIVVVNPVMEVPVHEGAGREKRRGIMV